MGWEPIGTYDELKVKPKRAAFYFKATEPTRLGGSFLPPIVELNRHYGIRECNHWHPIADTKDLEL